MTRAGFDTQGTFFPEQLPNVKENGWVKWFVRSDLFALYNRTTLARLWSHPADIFRGHLKQLGCVSNLFAFPGSSNTIELNEWLSMAKLMRVVQKRWLKESVGAVNTTLIADPITADLYRRSGPGQGLCRFLGSLCSLCLWLMRNNWQTLQVCWDQRAHACGAVMYPWLEKPVPLGKILRIDRDFD